MGKIPYTAESAEARNTGREVDWTIEEETKPKDALECRIAPFTTLFSFATTSSYRYNHLSGPADTVT